MTQVLLTFDGAEEKSAPKDDVVVPPKGTATIDIQRIWIHPKVVMKVGGWSELDTLMEHLDEPTETMIVREFDRAEYLGIDEWKLGDEDRPSKEVSQLGLDDYESN